MAKKKNVNMRRGVTLEHCFGGEKIQETTRRRKTLKCYMKSKLYLKQQLLKVKFAVKDYWFR